MILLQKTGKNIWVFPAMWLLTFLIYIPAAKAGWVIDAAGFMYGLQHDSFWDFINRTHSVDQSFYQLFTLHYYICYKLWGLNLWMWSLLYITVQSLNATLFFIVCKNILADTGIKNGVIVSLCGTLLFMVNPHVSEIVICKAYYHYLQSFFFILLIIWCVQKYQHYQSRKYIWWSALLFILCAFTLEIFYLIPVFVLSLALYYRFALGYEKPVLKKTALYFFVPQLVLLCLYFVALYSTFKFLKPHKIELTGNLINYLSKPAKYLFHIVFLGRYFTGHAKNAVYAFCESGAFLVLFYSLFISLCLYLLTHLKRMNSYAKAISLFGFWSAICVAFVMPLSFPDAALLVFYDRYAYFASGFLYISLVLLVSRTGNRYVAIALLCVYSAANLYFTIKVNMLWKQSAYITNRLLHDLPAAGNKTIVLLNIPENMKGVPMIGAQPESEYKVLHDIFADSKLHNNVYDAASYNMNTMDDGAHVMVINDSMIHVTLNQWGTWWWYEGHGGINYENTDYKLNMADPGHWYELTLKHPADKYLLLYESGAAWKIVDMNKTNEDQN